MKTNTNARVLFTHSDGDGYILIRVVDSQNETHDWRLTKEAWVLASLSLAAAIKDELEQEKP